MKYDLNRLKEAMDREIPAMEPNKLRLKQAAGSVRPKRRYVSYALTAAVAVVLIMVVLTTLWPKGIGPGWDYLEGGSALSPGMDGGKPLHTPEPTASVNTESLSDPGDYIAYSPDWALAAFPEEKICGDVAIRKTQDGRFAFEYEETGEAALPGLWAQGFAYYPLTGTALVGNGEGLALLGKDGLTTDFLFNSFQYAGNGAAIVSMTDERAQAGAEGLIPYRIVSAADGRRLSDEEYDEIGVTMSEETTFLLGVCYGRTAIGQFAYDDMLYTDVMDLQGSVIVRCYEFWGYSDGKLKVRMEKGGGIRLYDLNGNELLDGMEFSFFGAERYGMSVVWLHEGGIGVLDSEGSWVIEPGTYFTVDIRGENLFEVNDYTGEEMLVDSDGREVKSLLFSAKRLWRRLWLKAEDWAWTMGQAGTALTVCLAVWLLIRWRLASSQGRARHMLWTELGWAMLAAGFLLISHRRTGGQAYLWPTDPSLGYAREMAFLYEILALGGLTAMLASWKRMRARIWMLLAGAVLLAGPWLFKDVCSDMSVADWRMASILVAGALAVLIIIVWKTKVPEMLFAKFRATDEESEYTRAGRRVWYALTLAAALHFMLGCLLSGQKLISFDFATAAEPGVQTVFDEQWMDEVRGLKEVYVLSGRDEDALREVIREEGGWEKAAAARWMDENGVDCLTEEMFVTVRAHGEVILKRNAQVQMYLVSDPDAPDGHTLTLRADSPMREGNVLSYECIVLLAPGKTLPDMKGNVIVTQPSLDWIASQSMWVIDAGVLLSGEGEGETEPAPAEYDGG